MSDAMSDNSTSLMTIRQVAKALTLNEWTVRDWISDGRLPAVKLGPGERAPVRIRESDVEKLLIPFVPRGPRNPRGRRRSSNNVER